VLGLVGLELGDEPLDVTGGLAVVASGPPRVVPGAQVVEELIGLLVGLDVLQLVLALVERLPCCLLHLVEEAHERDLKPLRAQHGPPI
jgi:hypothetical protein